MRIILQRAIRLIEAVGYIQFRCNNLLGHYHLGDYLLPRGHDLIAQVM